MFIINLSAVINKGSDVESFNLQADLEFDFLSMGIAHSALVKSTDHLFKHFDGSADENDDSNVEMC